MGLCLYRIARQNGRSCDEPSTSNPPYCSRHKYLSPKSKDLQLYIAAFPSHITSQNLYACFQNHHDIHMAYEALSFLCSHEQLYEIAIDLKLPLTQYRKRKSKETLLQHIIEWIHYLHTIENSAVSMKFIHQVQRRVRQKADEKLWMWRHIQGPWPQEAAVNDTDIFTMDALKDLPPYEVYSYRDKHGSIYAFSAPEIHYEVMTNGPKNPYTREDIPEEDIDRLLQIMEYLPHKHLPRPEETWTNAEQAFEYVSGIYERCHGIFIRAEWLLRLKRLQMVHIFCRFHKFVRQESMYMNLDVLDECTAEGNDIYHVQYALALEMLRLAEAKDDPYQMYFICVMFFCIAEQSFQFRKHLPSWIYLGASS